MPKFTQIPADAFKNLQLNAGILLSDFDPATGEASNDSIIGATTGGTNFTATPTYSDFGEDIDNCPTNMLELKRLDSLEVTLSGTFVTADTATAKMLVGAGDAATTDGLTKIIPRNDVKTSDFSKIWWVGDYGDSDGGFMAIELLNALNTGGFALQTTDKGKGNFAFTFTGHYSMAAQDTVPYNIYIKQPTATSEPEEPSENPDGE